MRLTQHHASHYLLMYHSWAYTPLRERDVWGAIRQYRNTAFLPFVALLCSRNSSTENSSNSFHGGKWRTPETRQRGEIALDKRRTLRTGSTGLKTSSLSALQRGNHSAYGAFMLSPSDKPFMAPAQRLTQGSQIPYTGLVSLCSVYMGHSGTLPQNWELNS